MELTFDKGRGYVPAERNKQAIIEKNDINTLPVDSIYTPVLKVNYNVESTRVGQAIDYDKLTIEVWTDGTINAQEAVSLAARVLTEHLNLFVNLSEEAAGTEIMVEKNDHGRAVERPADHAPGIFMGSGDQHRKDQHRNADGAACNVRYHIGDFVCPGVIRQTAFTQGCSCHNHDLLFHTHIL